MSAALVVIALTGSTACSGSSDLTASEEALREAERIIEGSQAPEPQPSDATAAPVIDVGSMPSEGVVLVEVDGQSFEFNLAEASLGSDCEITPERVELQFQAENATLNVEFSDLGAQGGTPGQFAGNATLSPVDLDTGEGEAYGSVADPPRIAIAPPHVVIETGFVYRETHADYTLDDVGEGRISATCP